MINTRLYQKFHEESCLKHARAFYAAGEWDSDRARHCRISCQKGTFSLILICRFVLCLLNVW